MPSAIYTALNGREIREIVKNKIIKEIDSLPYLREGNTFHRANVQFAFVMQAYPADVPVPNKELEFTIDAKSIDDFEEALNGIKSADKLVEQINELKLHREQIDNLLNQALELQPLMIRELDIQSEIDGSKPDAVRIENDLPVIVEKVEGGKRTEQKVSAVQFKSMVK
jgi:hypothetical protein